MLTQLPPANKNALGALIIFLAKLCKKSAVNNMTTQKVGVIFGGFLLKQN